MNRYYLIDFGAARAGRLTALQARFDGPPAGRREQPERLLHYRVNLAGTQAIAQGELTAANHTALTNLPWVTYLGDFDPTTGLAAPAVVTFLASNKAAWEVPL